MAETDTPRKHHLQSRFFWGSSALLLIATLVWCGFLAEGNVEKASLAFVLCAAAFLCGSLLGFIFTIFGDEKEPFGKIRDAVIALASGITGIGIGKATDIGGILGSVHVLRSSTEESSWFSVLLVTTFLVAGFYFMYFARILFFNPRLAEGRRAIDLVRTSDDASIVAIKVTEQLSPSLLLGRDFISEVDELDEAEAGQIKAELYADDVSNFLKACDENIRDRAVLQPDHLAMAARLQYYRVYFEKEGTNERDVQEKLAHAWLSRALMCDPTNPDLQIKLADVYAIQARYDETVVIMERLERSDDAPQYTQQWLGYYLLFIDGREDDAIRHSLGFFERFPSSDSSVYNVACGYAQKYQIELDNAGLKEKLDSANRIASLRFLRQAIRINANNKKSARRDSGDDGSFKSLSSDPEFLDLINEPSQESN